MTYVVTLNNGLVDVVLPDGNRYQGGNSATLSDAQYGQLSSTAAAALFSSVVNTEPGLISSVNSKTGPAVVLTASDVGAYDTTSAATLAGRVSNVESVETSLNTLTTDAENRVAGVETRATSLEATRTNSAIISVKDHGAKGDNTTDDTANIQAAINLGGITFFPPGQYRVTTLTLPEGAVLRGASGGGFGIENADTQQAHITLIAGTNNNLLYVPVGAANIIIEDLFLDGNKNNNTSGDCIHIDDTGSPEEVGMVLNRVHIEASAGYGIYLGTGRRALKAYRVQILNAGSSNLRVNGSDSTWDSCLFGSATTDNIQVGAAVTRFVGCDIWGATQTGINILSSIQQVTIMGCGIDRNGTHGIFVGTGADAINIIGNDFHSNSQTTNGGAHHIQVSSTSGGINIIGNITGVDSGITHAAGYFVYFAVTGATAAMFGNRVMPNSTNLGLTNDLVHSGRPVPNRSGWFPTNAKAVTVDRMTVQGQNQTAPWSTGTLYCAGGAVLPAGIPISSVTFLFGSTAAAGVTSCWYAILDQQRNVLAVTADNGSGTIPTSGSLTLNLTASYVPTWDMPVYLAACINATTMPSVIGTTNSGTATAIAPILCGNSTTGLSAPLAVAAVGTALTSTAVNAVAWAS